MVGVGGFSVLSLKKMRLAPLSTFIPNSRPPTNIARLLVYMPPTTRIEKAAALRATMKARSLLPPVVIKASQKSLASIKLEFDSATRDQKYEDWAGSSLPARRLQCGCRVVWSEVFFDDRLPAVGLAALDSFVHKVSDRRVEAFEGVGAQSSALRQQIPEPLTPRWPFPLPSLFRKSLQKR